jgi:hypothetical protein
MKPNSGLDVARPPIIDEISHVLPDDLREEKEDVACFPQEMEGEDPSKYTC